MNSFTECAIPVEKQLEPLESDDEEDMVKIRENTRKSQLRRLSKKKNIDSVMNIENSTITLTFGDVSENHVGNQQLGTLAEEGLSIDDLLYAQQQFERGGYETDMIHLNSGLEGVVCENSETEDAYVLVIKNGVDYFLRSPVANSELPVNANEALFLEQAVLNHDKKAVMYGKVLIKHARWNLCFTNTSQESDYEIGNGTVVAFEDVPLTSIIRDGLCDVFGEKTRNLNCEGNYYHTKNKCGIGFHGDAERRIVIAVRLGSSMPLKYQWFFKCKAVGSPIEINLNGGDVYAMSAKAVGHDFKKRNRLTLRHAAGCKKYTTLKKKQISQAEDIPQVVVPTPIRAPKKKMRILTLKKNMT